MTDPSKYKFFYFGGGNKSQIWTITIQQLTITAEIWCFWSVALKIHNFTQ